MKPRDRPAPGLGDVPPLALRMFDDPSQQEHPAELGQAVYGSREAWIGARREWETAHGLTLAEWFALACEDGGARGGLDGLNAAFSWYFTEADDAEDPRVNA